MGIQIRLPLQGRALIILLPLTLCMFSACGDLGNDSHQSGLDEGMQIEEVESALSCGGLGSGESLARGQSSKSCNGRATLIHQTDGNVVLYDEIGPLWQSHTSGKATTNFVMQTDGNLVLYNGAAPLWFSGTFNNPGAWLAVQTDCNMVVYSSAGNVLWQSWTQCRSPDLSNYPVYGINFYGDGAESTIKNGKGMWSLEMIYTTSYNGVAQRAKLQNIRDKGFKIILRLDYDIGYTIPPNWDWSKRQSFALTAKQIAADVGDLVDLYVIGNEPLNPSAGAPSKEWYTAVFNSYDGNCVYDRIKEARPGALVSIFAPGGWPNTPEFAYFDYVLNHVDKDSKGEPQIDAFALHAYSGAETSSNAKAEDPRHADVNDFGVFRLYAQRVYDKFSTVKPIFITETNTYWYFGAWATNVTSSDKSYRKDWMKEAYQAIGEWNASNDQKINGLLWYVYQHCGVGCADQYENSLARTDPGAGMLSVARSDFSWVTANTNIIPGKPGSSLKFQAENFMNSDTGNGMGTTTGSVNVDYFDTTNGNTGGEYRIEPGDSVDILRLPTWDGFAVGWTDAGEWLRYETLAGGVSYKLRVRYSRGVSGTSRVRLVIDGQSKSTLYLNGTKKASGAYDWDTYQEVLGSEVIPLPRGKHDIRVYFDDGSVNLDWFQLERV